MKLSHVCLTALIDARRTFDCCLREPSYMGDVKQDCAHGWIWRGSFDAGIVTEVLTRLKTLDSGFGESTSIDTRQCRMTDDDCFSYAAVGVRWIPSPSK